MFENSDPNDSPGIPAVPIAALGPPYMELIPDGTQIRLRFQWPATYINRVLLGTKSAPHLGTPFTNVTASVPVAGLGSPNTWDMIVAPPPAPMHFTSFICHCFEQGASIRARRARRGEPPRFSEFVLFCLRPGSFRGQMVISK